MDSEWANLVGAPAAVRGKVLLWLAEDLRLEDNLALALAMGAAHDGLAVLRVLPEARGRPRRTLHRQEIEDAAELRLARHFAQAGISFEVLGTGDDTSIARACRRLGCTSVIRNAADGTPLELAYRAEWERELGAMRIPLQVVNGEMIRRVGPGGAKPARPFLSEDAAVEPGALPEDHPLGLLRAYLHTLPDRNYLADMWIPGRDRRSSSQLSTHFAAGTLSSDRAAVETLRAERVWAAAHPGQSRTTEGASFRHFRGRVNFRPGFLTTFSRYEDKALPLATTAAQQSMVQAWRAGRTGIPMPDAAMRELSATGWINFRLRQMATSYAIQLLQLPPADVGATLAELFDDYEPGITWLQVALNDGTMGQERGPRILNPVKQGRDLDPSETYVRQWVPELAALPAGSAHEPWLHPDNPLPTPLVDHKAAFREARARWGNRQSALRPREDVLATHSAGPS